MVADAFVKSTVPILASGNIFPSQGASTIHSAEFWSGLLDFSVVLKVHLLPSANVRTNCPPV